MHKIIFIALLTGVSSFLTAQIFPAKYFEEAYFTNYYHKKTAAKLHQTFSTPIHVLQHLMKSVEIDDFNQVVLAPTLTTKALKKEQVYNILPFFENNHLGSYNCKLNYIIDFEYDGRSMAVIDYKLLVKGKSIVQELYSERLLLIKKGQRWYLFEDAGKKNVPKDFTSLSRIASAFAHLNAEGWEYLITGEATSVSKEMEELRYYIVDEQGINISKFYDLILYWGPKEGKRRMEQLYSYPPCRKFRGWDDTDPSVKKWFDRRGGVFWNF